MTGENNLWARETRPGEENFDKGTGTDHAPIPKRRQENLSELR